MSQARLTDSASAFRAGDCATTVDKANASISALSNRPEPYELLAYCNERAQRPRVALTAMSEAVERDPHNWRYRYGLAIARGRAGRDPRGAARQALRLNPRELLARKAVSRLRGSHPAGWRRAATRLPIPID